MSILITSEDPELTFLHPSLASLGDDCHETARVKPVLPISPVRENPANIFQWGPARPDKDSKEGEGSIDLKLKLTYQHRA